MNKSNIKTIILITFFTFISRFLGLIREVLFANNFGISKYTDTFFISIFVITIFTEIFRQAITTTLVPILIKIQKLDSKYTSNMYVSSFIGIMLIISSAVTLFVFLYSRSFVSFIAPSFPREQIDFAVSLINIGLFSISISVLASVYRGYLNSRGKFIENSLADFSTNIILILYLFFISGLFSFEGYIIAMNIALIFQIIIQLPILKSISFSFKINFSTKNPYMRSHFLNIMPVLLSVGISDINGLIDNFFASGLDPGSLSLINYGLKVKNLIVSILILPFSTIFLPIVSKIYNEDKNYFIVFINKVINFMILILLPMSFFIAGVSYEIIEVIYQRGEFLVDSTIKTSTVLIAFSIGILGFGGKIILNQIFYSLHKNIFSFYGLVIGLVSNLIFNILLAPKFGIVGLAFATSLSAFFSFIFLLFSLNKFVKLNFSFFLKNFIKVIIISFIMFILSKILNDFLKLFLNSIILLTLLRLFLLLISSVIFILISYIMLKLIDFNQLLSFYRKSRN